MKEEQAHPVDVHVGKMLRTLRKRAGKSQQALADSIGVSFQQVQKYERGTNRVSASKLWEIGEHLGVSVNAFYEGLGGPAASDRTLPEEVIAFVTSPEGRQIARIFPRVPEAQRGKLVELVEIMAR